MLASLLEELDDTSGPSDIDAVFASFDASRRERDQWLVLSSRRAATVYEWQLPRTGRGYFEEMKQDIEARQLVCWEVDLDGEIGEAKSDLKRRLGVKGG